VTELLVPTAPEVEPVPELAAGEALLEVPTLDAGPPLKLTDPRASWTLNGGGGTAAVALVEPEVEVEVELDARAPVDGEVPLVVELLPPLLVDAPVEVLVQAGLPAVDVPVVTPEEADAAGRTELAGTAEAELAAPLTPLVDAAVLGRADELMLLGALAAAPVLGPADWPLAQPANTSEAAARVGMRAFNIAWTPPLGPLRADKDDLGVLVAAKLGPSHDGFSV
jgi:hypothetical protein